MTTEELLLGGPSIHGRKLGLLLLLGLVLFGAGLGMRDPWPADEPRFALVAVQMADSGQWLIPMRGAEPYPDKPPLFFWAVALAYRSLGSLRVAFLLPVCQLARAADQIVGTHVAANRRLSRMAPLIPPPCRIHCRGRCDAVGSAALATPKARGEARVPDCISCDSC